MSSTTSTSFGRYTRSLSPAWNFTFFGSRNYDLLPPSPDLPLALNGNSYAMGVEAGHASPKGRLARFFYQRPMLRAVGQLLLLFVVGSTLLGGTLYLALPSLDDVDRPLLHVPTSFDELKALNTLLQKLKTLYPARTVICFVVTYLYLQAFSLPGSMYLSILAGAVWGVPFALPLCCLCVASGATLCYLISACFGPALLALPKIKNKIEQVAQKMDDPTHRQNLIPYMIVLRMTPLPPHWTINMACPHLGIGIAPFWVSAFLGVMGVTTIHTTIGGGLEQMTSSEDFHLISWRNFFGLGAVLFAVCVPIVLRWRWRKELQDSEDRSSDEDLEAAGPLMREVASPNGTTGVALATPGRRGLEIGASPRIPIIRVQEMDDDDVGPVGSLGLIGVGRTWEQHANWRD